MTPAAVCDTDPSRLAAAKEVFAGIQTFTSVDEMLEKSNVDLVAIITPHNSHAGLAVKCLAAGKHVVVEKPMAITTEECDRMIETARANNCVLSAFHNRHWDGHIRQAVSDVKAGLIGDVIRVEAHLQAYDKPGDWWRSSKSISGGILYDWGVHMLEYTLQLVDSEIEEVSGFAKTGFWADQCSWKQDTNEDEGFVVVRYKSGAWSTLNISSIDSSPNPEWLGVTGTSGAITMGPCGENYKVISQRDGKRWVSEVTPPPDEAWRYYQNIADHLVSGEPMVITAEWSRRPIHIIDLACKSARVGKALPALHK
jgi:predicted dehydrogenase